MRGNLRKGLLFLRKCAIINLLKAIQLYKLKEYGYGGGKMKKNLQKCLALAMVGTMLFSVASCGTNESDKDDGIILKDVQQAKNVILLIGDGMGPEQIKAGELFKGEKLAMQKFPYQTKVETRSASDLITDSAAAATALATGTRTSNGKVGQDVDSNELETIVDIAHGLGKRTGILATEELYGATPMGFAGHSVARSNYKELLTTAAKSSNVNLFASSKIDTYYQDILTGEGYTLLKEADKISEATEEKIFGSYTIWANYDSMMAEDANVAFDRLVTEALEYLSQDEDGFFLMAEGSHIDHGGHNNDICYMLEELIAFNDAVEAVLNWAKDRDDTVVLVTADHETGGLELEEKTTHKIMHDVYMNYGLGDCYTWTSTGHTNTDVNLYINGAKIDFSKYYFEEGVKRIKNTDVFQIMKYLMVGENVAE